MAVSVLGVSRVEIAAYGTTSPFDLTLPAATRDGDYVIIGQMYYDDEGTEVGDLGDYALRSHDSINGWQMVVWAGPWDGRRINNDSSQPAAPITLVGAGTANSTGQFNSGSLMVLRYTDGIDPNRPTLGGAPDEFGTPAIAGTGPAVAVRFARAGLGGIGGANLFPEPPWMWQRAPVPVASYCAVYFALHAGPTVEPATRNYGGNAFHWSSAYFGIIPVSTGVAPLRCFPRDDALGPQTGRSIPPPTSWQSGRRYGGGAIR